jgi:hypothetical protein
LIGLWFGDHGNALRFYVLLVGIMNLFYVVWDYIDERLFDKRNTSDCAQFSELLGWPSSGQSACPDAFKRDAQKELIDSLAHILVLV